MFAIAAGIFRDGLSSELYSVGHVPVFIVGPVLVELLVVVLTLVKSMEIMRQLSSSERRHSAFTLFAREGACNDVAYGTTGTLTIM